MPKLCATHENPYQVNVLPHCLSANTQSYPQVLGIDVLNQSKSMTGSEFRMSSISSFCSLSVSSSLAIKSR